jgi:AraC-like DNA-binding protein
MQTIRQFFDPAAFRTQDLQVNAIGISERMSNVIVNRPAGTGDYLLMAFMDPVTIRAGDEDLDCGASTMMIWDIEHGHYYGNVRQRWLHSWIHCDGRRVAHLIDGAKLPVNRPFSLHDPGVVDSYLWEIYREITEQSSPCAQIVLNSIHSWLLEMNRQLEGPHNTIPTDLLALRHFLGENVDRPMRLSDMAARANMSQSHLSAQFKHYFGVAPVEYHIQLRLRAAAYLLRDGNRPVADVARAVGYDDPFYFSKQFKARFRISPREVRTAS